MQAGHSHDDGGGGGGGGCCCCCSLIVEEAEYVKSLPPSTAKVTTSNNCEVGMWPRYDVIAVPGICALFAKKIINTRCFLFSLVGLLFEIKVLIHLHGNA